MLADFYTNTLYYPLTHAFRWNLTVDRSYFAHEKKDEISEIDPVDDI